MSDHAEKAPMHRYGGLTLGAVAPWLIGALLLAAMPYVFSSNSAITIMNQMAITIVFALSYNMLLGQGGMLSFGHAVYMGIGGFGAMHVMNWMEDGAVALPLPLLPLVAGLFGLGFAIIIGVFSTRKAGTVFAMISLGIGELVASSSLIVVAFFGGEEGVSGDRTYGIPVFGHDFASQTEVYYLIAGWLLLATLLMYLFSRTPVGRMANAVRDNPERAEFLGYSARWVRFYSFCASGFFAGIAGGLFAVNYEILTAENLDLATSGTILLITFLGGIGFFFGPIIGAIVFTLLQSVLSLQTDLWQLYVGALFVLTVMFFPGGLAGVIMMHVPPWRNGKMRALVRPYLATVLPAGIGILGLASFLEVLFHVRRAAVGEAGMTLFWIHFSSHDVRVWIGIVLVTLLSFWLARRNAPALRAAWDFANTPPEAAPKGDPK